MDISAAAIAVLLATTSAETVEPKPKTDRTDHFRIGAIAGVGFPRPLGVEGLVHIERTVGLGFEYGAMPNIDISNVRVSYWAAAGDARFFIAKGPFYIGMKFGMQKLSATGSMSIASLTFTEQAEMETWFVNPHVGLMFTWKPGFTLGVGAGVQVPVSSSIKSTIPLSVMPSEVQTTANLLGSTVLPTLDLIRLGFLF